MAHDVHFEFFDDARVLDRFIVNVQANNSFEWQHVCAAQIKVRVRRWKSVKVRSADGGEQQRIWLRRDDSVEAWIDIHTTIFPPWRLQVHATWTAQAGIARGSSTSLGFRRSAARPAFPR